MARLLFPFFFFFFFKLVAVVVFENIASPLREVCAHWSVFFVGREKVRKRPPP